MTDRNPIPFWGKSKPTRRYVQGHSLSYKVRNGKLFCIVTITTNYSKVPMYEFEVKSKEQLNKLLKVESPDEIPTIEVVA